MGADSAEAAEKFKEISTAYAILSDPNKKRQYDMCGKDAESLWVTEMEAYDVENLNSLQRVFGALATTVGVPIHTSVSQPASDSSNFVAMYSERLTDAQAIQFKPCFVR